ncbi:oligopeptide/dipeptide ABC transporter, ATPase subunit (plasmid) [halophilic archaeon DL31]|nr:oligopeptide/dipeptide ABC transporter, ATPase subunit [halophilic archaeon DL31]
MSDTPILELHNVQKYFKSGGRIERILGEQEIIQAVENVSLEVHPKETVALIGESGCGKSTVAKTVIGLHEETDGEVRFKGEPLTSDNVSEKGIGMVFQDPAESLNPRRTVGAILAGPLKQRGVEDIDSEIDELLEQVGLGTGVQNRYPGTFSGGQKQRIAIARALASDPELLIADEPVSGLDVSVQAKIINLLNELQEEMDLSLLLISHNLGVVRTIAHRVNIMYLGEIVERGATNQVFTDPGHPYTQALLSAIHLPEPGSRTERVILSGELPNPASPPSGCRFHTRCPEARKACAEEHPDRVPVNGETDHRAACLRRIENHDYWDSPQLDDDSREETRSVSEKAADD